MSPGKSGPRPRRRGLALAVLGALAGAVALPVGAGPVPAVAAPAAQRWVRHELINPNVWDVAVDASGAIWARMGGTRRGPSDLVIGIARNGRPQVQSTLTDVVAGRFDAIRRQGDLPDFWSVDKDNQIWIGPSFYNGRTWTVVDRDMTGAAGMLRYDYRALADASGLAWVPYAVFPACPGPDPCDQRGLRALDAKGQQASLLVTPLYEADAWGVADLRFVLAAGSGATPNQRPVPFAVARAALYRLPDTAPVSYPFLGPPSGPSQLRNAGYATAAARRPDGRLHVLTWVELQKPEGVEQRIFANTWTEGQGWDTPEDWTDSPLVAGNAKAVRLIAAAWSPGSPAAEQPVLWVAASSGSVARQRGGKWDLVFGANDIGLPPQSQIRDLAVGLDSTLWMATDAGLFSYGEIGQIPPPARAYLPAVGKR